MTVHDKIEELGKAFPYNTFVVFTMDGGKGRIIYYGITDKAEAMSYKPLGKKNGIDVTVCEYNVSEGSMFFY